MTTLFYGKPDTNSEMKYTHIHSRHFREYVTKWLAVIALLLLFFIWNKYMHCLKPHHSEVACVQNTFYTFYNKIKIPVTLEENIFQEAAWVLRNIYKSTSTAIYKLIGCFLGCALNYKILH